MAINEQVYQMADKVCDKWNEYYISVYPVLQFLLCPGLVLPGRETFNKGTIAFGTLCFAFLIFFIISLQQIWREWV